jgi:hypothetical protein
MDLISLSEQRQEACLPISHFQWIQPELAPLTKLFGSFFHLQQYPFEFGGPPQSLLFCQVGQIPQQMHI